MIKQDILDEQQNKYTALIIAKVLITLAVYFIASASLLEHFSVIDTLKALGFMLCIHAFYFLSKYKSYI